MPPPGMQGKAAKKSRRSRGSGDPLRIVLVGRTGLDGRLRLDPSVELFRAATALDAVGELAQAVGSDGQAVPLVIVSPASEPSEHADRQEFINALRRVSEQVRILRLDDGGDAPVEYDGVLAAEAGIDAVRAALNGRHADGPAVPQATRLNERNEPNAVSEPHVSDVPDVPDVPHMQDEAPEGASSDWEGRVHAALPGAAGDEVLVRLLLQGRDITDAAVGLVRQRIGGRDVTYVTTGASPRDGDGVHEASVAWRGRMLGRLRSREVPPEELAIHASWLASWLVLRDQHAQLRDAAFADPLTGAHNRRYFDQFLQLAMEEARRERRGVTLLMFDIDDFKKFNDRYGHGAGDEILRETVRLLRSVIRPSDKVCRIGGDEFAVVFYEPTGPRTPSSRPPNDVCDIAQRFQQQIAQRNFPKLGREAPGTLTISGGLATYPWDGATPGALLARADELAMQSKRAGKNCILFGPAAEGDAREDSTDR